MKFDVVQLVGQLEDRRFFTDSGWYTYGVDPGTGLLVAVLRAPYAYARLKSLYYGTL